MSRESQSEPTTPQQRLLPLTHDGPGIRTYLLLVVAMAFVIVCVTSFSLLLVQQRLRNQVTSELSQDLNHSVVSFHDLQGVRLGALERENALLADLPPLPEPETRSVSRLIQPVFTGSLMRVLRVDVSGLLGEPLAEALGRHPRGCWP